MGEKKGLLRFLKLDGMVDHLTGLVETKIELAKVEIKEDLAHFLSKLVPWILILIIAFFCLFFLNMAVGFYLGSILKSNYLGFLILGGFYLFMTILLVLLRNKLGLFEFFEDKLRDIFR